MATTQDDASAAGTPMTSIPSTVAASPRAPATGAPTRVDLVRTGRLRFRATNARGDTLDMGDGSEPGFSPVELLLAAIAGCTGMDVDAITGKRADAERFEVSAQAEKMRDRDGNHLVNITVNFEVAFAADEAGSSASAVLESAIRKSHDRLCIVTRTVELPSPIAVQLDAIPLTFGTKR